MKTLLTSCSICLEHFKNPVCPPCGHIFCSQCILSTIQSVKPYIPLHRCPTCDISFNIAPVDMKAVPKNLRPFITPSIRRLFIEAVPPESSFSSSDTFSWTNAGAFGEADSRSRSSLEQAPVTEMARLRAENHALRNHCALWRNRAETHGKANLTLLNLARVLRDQASQIARDRNDLEKRCFLLKQMIDGDCSYSDEMLRYEPGSDLPVDDLHTRSQNTPDQGKSEVAAHADDLGQPRKRRRVSIGSDGDL